MGDEPDVLLWCSDIGVFEKVRDALLARTDLPDLEIEDWSDTEEDEWRIHWDAGTGASPASVFADLCAAIPGAERGLSLDDKYRA